MLLPRPSFRRTDAPPGRAVGEFDAFAENGTADANSAAWLRSRERRRKTRHQATVAGVDVGPDLRGRGVPRRQITTELCPSWRA